MGLQTFSIPLHPYKFCLMPRSGGVVTENIRIALSSVRSHWLRSILTMLIIAFGITALVGILTAIDGIRYSLTDQFSRMGANTFSIRNQAMILQEGSAEETSPPITYRQAREFCNRFEYGTTVSYFTWGNQLLTVRFRDRKTNPNISMIGCNENYLTTSGYDLGSGRNFSATEVADGASVAIIGSVLAERLFQSVIEPVGQVISAGSQRYKVIGVLKSKGSSMGFSNDNNLFVPVNNLRQHMGDRGSSYEINVKASDAESMEATIAEATVAFRKIRQLDPKESNDFSIESSDNLVRILVDNISTITMAATLIGLITLLGAAIGLMNIMLVSVTERTREIGIRKAMGATSTIIRNQFLIEAVTIGILGGIIGIIGGVLIGNITTMLTGGSFLIPWGWMSIGIALCIITGLVSGIYPASKAASLDPIESLRYE